VIDALDIGTLTLRVALGVVCLAHGYNHIFGGGKVAGTARWFESVGMRPGRMHAWLASLTELGCGVLLIVGFATPLACAGVIGTMLVAIVTVHRKNGFFIFRPGEGYEYVMTLALASVALAGIGPGRISLDSATDIYPSGTWAGLLIAVIVGLATALGLLVGFWRPNRVPDAAPAV
jgi:putative oxidoreductase